MLCVQVDFWLEPNGPGKRFEVLVEPKNVENLRNFLLENQIGHEIVFDDLEKFVDAKKFYQKKNLNLKKNFQIDQKGKRRDAIQFRSVKR